METTKPQTRGATEHVTSLDGIRALCILAVMGHHFGFCDPGWIGVEMFFVLSGFLITTLLCRENEKTGMISLGRFWARRAFRLLPIYWLYISLVTAAILLRHPGDWAASSPWSPGLYIASLWGYFVNFAPPRMWVHQGPTYHLWSLAMEEQFYFCWPFLCVIALRLRRPWLLPFFIFVLSALGRAPIVPQPYAWLMTYAPIGIIIGCTIALLFYFNRGGRMFRLLTSAWARNLAALVCIGCLAILEIRTRARGDNAVRPWANRWLIPIYVWPFAVLIAGLWYGQPIALGRALSFGPLAFLGRISYGMYLYHMVLIDVVKRAAIWSDGETGVHLRFAIVVVLYLLCVTCIASLSYYFIEKPFLQIGARFRAQGRGARSQRGQDSPPPLHIGLAVESGG
jgi:peptidoglycan/LPS O-acetylase OafA/YrhL